MNRLYSNMQDLRREVEIYIRNGSTGNPVEIIELLKTIGDQVDGMEDFLKILTRMDPGIRRLLDDSERSHNAHTEFIRFRSDIADIFNNLKDEFDAINRQYNDPNNEYRPFSPQ